MQASLGVAHAIDAFGNQKLLVPMPRCVAGHDLGDGACGDIALQIRLPVSTSVASESGERGDATANARIEVDARLVFASIRKEVDGILRHKLRLPDQDAKPRLLGGGM